MRGRFGLIFLLVLVFPIEKSFAAHKDTLGGHIRFVENLGQWDAPFLYKTDFDGGCLFALNNALVFDLADQKAIRSLLSFKLLPPEDRQSRGKPSDVINRHAYSMEFVGSSATAVRGEEQLEPYFNYFVGNDPARWKSEVHAFKRIVYENLYNGTDLYVFESNEQLKYEFRLSAGADPANINIRYSGTNGLSLQEGNLIVATSLGKVVEMKPMAWQIRNGERVMVDCAFELDGNTVSFIFPSGFDPSLELIIDPILVFASYSGSTADNWGYTATFDSKGFLYAGGNIFATGYPTTTGAYQLTYGGNVDIVISKYDTTGAFLIYSTYLGGSGPEVPNSLIVNSVDELYVLGTTGSGNYPTTAGCIDNTFNGGTAYTLTYVIQYTAGSDMVVTCFNSAGNALLASTYFGGSMNDGLNMSPVLKHNYADDVRGEVLIDDNSNVYIVSSTASANFPVTTGCFQPLYGGGSQDGCVVKLDRLLTQILWSSFLGGSSDDAAYSISLDENNIPFIGGGTASTNFPIVGSTLYSSYQGGVADGFVARINLNGSSIVRSSYWGTSAYDQVYFAETDKNGNIYLFGQTASAGTSLIQNALWNTPGGGQFISKINSLMTNTIWSTTFGTGGGVVNISPTAFLVDYCDNIYLSGWGSPSLNGFGGTAGLPITLGAFQTTTDNNDYYFLCIKDDASAIVFGSFYGGSSAEHVDGGTSRFDRMGRIYQSVCAGCGGLDDFPTTSGAWSQNNNSSNCNNGVIKLDFSLPAIVADFIQPPVICLPASLNFTNTSYFPNAGTASCYWDFGDGTNSSSCNPSHIYGQSGTYLVTLIVTDLTSCNSADTIQHQVVVLADTSYTLPDAGMCVNQYTQIGILPTSDPSLTFQWSPSTGLSNNNIPNPIASPSVTTQYTLLISNGVCTDTIIQTVNVFDLQIDAGPDTLICSPTLIMTAVASGTGSAPSFQWSSDGSFSDMLNSGPSDPTAQVIYTSPHTYYVMVDNGYCTVIDSIFVDYQQIASPITSIEPLCFNDCNGSLSVSPSGGLPPYDYLWNTGATVDQISNLCADDYSVTITDQQGCQTIQNISLGQPALLFANMVTEPVNCDSACNGIITILLVGGTAPYTYDWSGGNASGNPASGLCEGNYAVTITDDHGCEYFDNDSIVVDYIFGDMNAWVDDDTIYQGQSTEIHATPISGLHYTWQPPYALSNPNSPSSTASPDYTTTYYITVEDDFGCKYIDSVIVVVLEVFCYEPYVFLPNSFSPNGDGNNDVLYVRSNYILDFKLAIFDRWGEKVFETSDQNTGWDGTFRGELLEPAVFDYYLEVTCFNQLTYFKKGNITLLR